MTAKINLAVRGIILYPDPPFPTEGGPTVLHVFDIKRRINVMQNSRLMRNLINLVVRKYSCVNVSLKYRLLTEKVDRRVQ